MSKIVVQLTSENPKVSHKSGVKKDPNRKYLYIIAVSILAEIAMLAGGLR